MASGDVVGAADAATSGGASSAISDAQGASGLADSAADDAVGAAKDRSGLSDLEQIKEEAEDQKSDTEARAERAERDAHRATDVDGAVDRETSRARGDYDAQRRSAERHTGDVVDDRDVPKEYMDARGTIDENERDMSRSTSRSESELGSARRDAYESVRDEPAFGDSGSLGDAERARDAARNPDDVIRDEIKDRLDD